MTPEGAAELFADLPDTSMVTMPTPERLRELAAGAELTEDELYNARLLWAIYQPDGTKMVCDRPGCDWFTWNMTPLFLSRRDPREFLQDLLDHTASHDQEDNDG